MTYFAEQLSDKLSNYLLDKVKAVNKINKQTSLSHECTMKYRTIFHKQVYFTFTY